MLSRPIFRSTLLHLGLYKEEEMPYEQHLTMTREQHLTLNREKYHECFIFGFFNCVLPTT